MSIAHLQGQLPSAERFGDSPYSRKNLSKKMGPYNPIARILDSLLIEDVFFFKDDFEFEVSTTKWIVNAGDVSFARVADRANGVIRGDAGSDQEAVLVCAANGEIWDAGMRCTAIGRFAIADMANSKFEFGFADEADIAFGQVLVSATPTSTGTDYAVCIRDTDNEGDTGASFDLIADNQNGANDGPVAVRGGLTAGAGGSDAFDDNEWFTVMVSLNEQAEARAWVNGQFVGRLTAGVPRGTTIGAGAELPGSPDTAVTPLSLWLNIVDRDASNTAQLDCDYIAAWQERSPVR